MRQLEEPGRHAEVLNTHPEARAVVLSVASKLPVNDKRKIIENHFLLKKYFDSIADDFRAIPVRLMLGSADAYSAYDRMRAEAEFRGAVALPFLALAFALRYNKVSAAIWCAVVAAATVLFYQARRRQVEANDQVAEILRAKNGEFSAVVTFISNGDFEFSNPALRDDEVKTIVELAQRSAESQPVAAIRWSEIWAATGSTAGHRMLCALTRRHERGMLQSRLGEAARHSGILAAEFVIEIFEDIFEDEFDSAFPPMVRGLLWGTLDGEWRSLFISTLERLFQPQLQSAEDYPEALNSLHSEIDRAVAGPTEMERFVKACRPDVQLAREAFDHFATEAKAKFSELERLADA
ncbi:hypothetical protein ABT297_36890 [Dactylosporangium sp. NPDC000555]|uniref:hypothetical protein n=1 Tax=Dactylosporangium sp. NPDC000555 TaxID=3154260 RepID=UPI00332AC285